MAENSSPAARSTKTKQPTSGSAEYSRKDKSLGLLCGNFVQEYGQQENEEICLDAAAATLRVERRRIYDIVNVLESVGIVTRKAKNCYIWRGFSCVSNKLDDLSKKAFSDLYGTPEDFRTPISNRKNAKKTSTSRVKAEMQSVSVDLDDSMLSQSQSQSQKLASVNSSIETEHDVEIRQLRRSSRGSRKEKSLGVLSQRFVQLFLLAGNRAVSLDQAAVQLLGRSPSDRDPLSISPVEGDATKLLKTKVRRLYDIANILSSLRLIEKVHTINRKPAFKWLGPESSSNAMAVLREGIATRARQSKESSLKRPATDSLDKGKRSAKRRKSFTRYIDGGMTTENSLEEKVASQTNGSPVTDAGLHDNGLTDAGPHEAEMKHGFDSETIAKVERVLSTFPESYAKTWRSYVESVNSMLMRGQVKREKAYECISNLLTESKDDEKNIGGDEDKQGECIDGESARKDSESQQLAVAEQLSAMATGSPVKQLSAGGWQSGEKTRDEEDKGEKAACASNDDVDMERGGSALDGEDDCDTRSSCETNVKIEPSNAPENVDQWNAASIEQYMSKARAAGPQHLRAAERWLTTFRQWQKMWSGSFAALTGATLQKQASSHAKAGHSPNAVAVQEKNNG